ncbi:MAG: pentapeptide repeat-containing protein [Cyanobacteria bacterium P01_G01_bin.67]
MYRLGFGGQITGEELLELYAAGERSFIGIRVFGSRMSLKGADLRGINLMGAELDDRHLNGADLSDIKCDRL